MEERERQDAAIREAFAAMQPAFVKLSPEMIVCDPGARKDFLGRVRAILDGDAKNFPERECLLRLLLLRKTKRLKS